MTTSNHKPKPHKPDSLNKHKTPRSIVPIHPNGSNRQNDKSPENLQLHNLHNLPRTQKNTTRLIRYNYILYITSPPKPLQYKLRTKKATTFPLPSLPPQSLHPPHKQNEQKPIYRTRTPLT